MKLTIAASPENVPWDAEGDLISGQPSGHAQRCLSVKPESFVSKANEGFSWRVSKCPLASPVTPDVSQWRMSGMTQHPGWAK